MLVWLFLDDDLRCPIQIESVVWGLGSSSQLMVAGRPVGSGYCARLLCSGGSEIEKFVELLLELVQRGFGRGCGRR